MSEENAPDAVPDEAPAAAPNDQPAQDSTAPKNTQAKVGGGVMGCGCLVMFAPLLLAFAGTAPGHNPFSESDSQSGGTYLWGMLLTLPLGFAIGIGGLATLIVGLVRRRK
jgi:hypothetical protein